MATREPIMAIDKAALFRDLGYQPHAGQIEVHNSTAPRRILSCGVRWGKSLCAAMEAIAAAMEPAPRSIGWCVGPTFELADKVYREIVIIVAEHLRHRMITLRESDKRIELRNMGGGISEIRAKSADNPVSLLGEGLNWLIIDECARMKPQIWESHLSQRLIDKHGWALMISTPKGKGWFFDLFRRGQGNDPDYASWNCPSWTNPHLDAAMIEQERDRLPERVFRQEYGGEFIEGSGSVFRNVRECATGTFQPPIPEKGYYAGIDLARVEDFTVLCIVNEQREVVFVDRFTKLDWNIQINRIRAATRRYNNAQILVDSTGAGEPVYETMLHAGLSVQPYSFTQKSKAALIDNLSLMFERRKLTLPRPDLWREGIDELEAFEYSITEQGTVRTNAPGGMHDDCVIALALAMWQVRPARPEPGVTWAERGPNGEIIFKSTHAWGNDGDALLSEAMDDDDDDVPQPQRRRGYYETDDDDDDGRDGGVGFLMRMLRS